MNNLPLLTIDALQTAYANGDFTPEELLLRVLDAAQNAPEGVWISLCSRKQILQQIENLSQRDAASLPLFGVPFAVKDNINVVELPTTAACPAFSFEPHDNATVVRLLCEAGAIVIGKTNLDQFATGLNGTRSPYGICRNALNDEYIAGGSSSGSAVAVASGIVSFALGTDTAGSGRVPAALNNIVGLKPTRGVWSMNGVVPACRSLDTVSVFTTVSNDAELIFSILAKPDQSDAYSRSSTRSGLDFSGLPSWKLGVPDAKDLQFFGDEEYAKLFAHSQQTARSLSAEIVEIDFAPFLEAAKLLYDGPWVAERFGVVKELLALSPESIFPVTREIIERGAHYSATDAFAAFEKLATLKKQCDAILETVDAILTPTIGRAYTIEEMLNEPIKLNTQLGLYTNFMNLLDYSALSLPSGFSSHNMPFGITFFARANQDIPLLRLGARWQNATKLSPGATSHAFDTTSSTRSAAKWDGAVSVAVCGAHMSGFPLNKQLTERGAKMVSQTRSAAKYRFYALPGGPPFRPGMVRVESGGASIEVEVWSVPVREYGSFVAGIPSPLGIGTVELEDGQFVQGFVCENVAIFGAEDITHLGSWRAWSPPNV